MKSRIKFSSEDEKREYVRFCDKRFEDRLDAVTADVLCRGELKFLTLSGPTCSGKTTLSKKLISEFNERGKRVKIISLDNFFRPSAELRAEAEAEGRQVDFDSERSIDLCTLYAFIKKLKNGEEALLPHFDFTVGRVTKSEPFSVDDADILIFEGIQAIYPVFTEMIKDIPSLSLIINVESSLEIGNTVMSPRNVRLMRRIVRDYRFRNASPEFSFQLWETVTANEDVNILPFTHNADVSIDSTMGYEPCMLKPFLVPLLRTIDSESKYFGKACEILSVLDGIDEISSDYIPKNSLYKEFI